jgi:APA family basic amino acid/polyamine antiporter
VLYGQSRILMSMSRDGLVPGVFARVSPRTSTPVAGTLIIGVVFAVPAAFCSLDAVVGLCTIGTLATMAAVNAALMVLRRREPDLPRTFRVPLYPVLPLLGIGCCVYLMYETGWAAWAQFAAFLAAGYNRNPARVAKTYRRTRSFTGGDVPFENKMYVRIQSWVGGFLQREYSIR